MKKPGGILAMILSDKKSAKGHGGGADEEESESESESEGDDGDVDTLLGDAYDALRDRDKEGFVRSMKAACRCL